MGGLEETVKHIEQAFNDAILAEEWIFLLRIQGRFEYSMLLAPQLPK